MSTNEGNRSMEDLLVPCIGPVRTCIQDFGLVVYGVMLLQ